MHLFYLHKQAAHTLMLSGPALLNSSLRSDYNRIGAQLSRSLQCQNVLFDAAVRWILLKWILILGAARQHRLFN